VDRSLALRRRAAAEGIAAFALVFAGRGATVADARYHGARGAFGVSLVFGLVIMGDGLRHGAPVGRPLSAQAFSAMDAAETPGTRASVDM